MSPPVLLCGQHNCKPILLLVCKHPSQSHLPAMSVHLFIPLVFILFTSRLHVRTSQIKELQKYEPLDP